MLSKESQARTEQLRDLIVSATTQRERSEAVQKLISIYEQQLAAYSSSVSLTERNRN